LRVDTCHGLEQLPQVFWLAGDLNDGCGTPIVGEGAEWDSAHRGGALRLQAMASEKHPESLANVQAGDVLVSHPTAVREHEISIVPNAPHTMSPTHDAAVVDGRSEAEALGVDAWLTEDQTHVVKIASHRTPGK
jgi:hypothetical protein